jgi:drug/metabolite transporter (DMT)-like permease
VLYGLIAALGWGMSAVAATNAARRAGTYLAVLSGQAIGVVVLVVLTAVIQPSFAVGASVLVFLAAAGLLGLVGYLAFYRALEYGGAVGLVSAISATYGGVTTVLAVVILGEHLGWGGALGVALAVAGTAAAAARPAASQADSIAVAEPLVGVAPAPARIRGLARAGVPLAIVAALAYGLGGFLLGRYSGRAGALVAALVAHGASIFVLVLALPLLGRRQAGRGSVPGFLWAGAAGLTDVVGLLAFARGGQVGQVALTAAVSSVFPVIPLVAGLVFFGEHLTARQVAGVAAIIAGLVLIGLA